MTKATMSNPNPEREYVNRELLAKAQEYADGQLLIPTAIELDEMRLLLRLLCSEVTRLRKELADFHFFEAGGHK